AEDGIRDGHVTGVQTCALPILRQGVLEQLVGARVPRYSQIAEALRRQILDGALAPGTRLDNQRRLACQFGVTLMTLRQALTVLEIGRASCRERVEDSGCAGVFK